MALQKPTAEQIQNWISGSLSAEEARVVEHYFDLHPEELPAIEPPALLKEATHAPSPEIDELIDSLKKQLVPKQGLPHVGQWLDYLDATSSPGILGRLGDLEVHQVLSSTAMAIVLKAHDAKGERWVAIKILAPTLAANPQAKERFLREAKAMAQLHHDAILPVYDITSGENPWFSMRYVSGGTLQDALDHEEEFLKTPEFITRLANKAAQALALAHREGLIHRDIKPANILLSNDRSQIWLSDFGIAKATDDPSLTLGQALTGTPRYMSPEQANCASLDNRSDIFSLGAVLYHCATGQAPFQGEETTQVLHQISTQAPTSIESFQTGLPPWLAQLITDCLQKNPADRPDLLTALKERTVRRDFSRVKKTTLVLLPLLLLTTIIIWKFAPPSLPETELAQESKNEILVPTTGKRFQDLAQAIHQSPPNSRFILKGTLLVNNRIATPPGTGLHLEAAPGKSARIVIQNTPIGLEIGGNVTLKGIRFEHYGPPGEKITVLARDAERLSVSNCFFYSDAKNLSDRSPHWAMQAQAITRTIIERCTFQGQTMGAVVLYDAKQTRPFRDGNLIITDCLLHCSTAILLRSRGANSEFDVVAERIVFRGNYLIAGSKHNDFRPTRLTLRNSLIDASEATIFDFQGDLQTSEKLLTVSSENSLYDGPTGALVVTGKKAAIKHLPIIDKARTPLFGEQQLLRENLPAELSHPALQTFRTAPEPLSDFKFLRNQRK